MKVVILFIYCLSITLAFYPVKDFRVKDLQDRVLSGAGSKKTILGSSKGTNPQAAKLPSTTNVVSTTDSLSTSAPTIELSNDIQMVSTDSSNSIYYLNSRFVDELTGYNKTFQLLLDTGSSITWVYNESCSSDACKQDTIEKFNDFDDALDIVDDFHLSYSGQKVTGELINGYDNNINVTLDDISISNFTFGLASSVPDLFDGFNVSGILGIPSSNDSSVERSLIHQLNYNSVIDKQIFGLSLVSSAQTIKYIDDESNLLDLPSNYGGLMILGSKALDYKQKFVDEDSKVFYAPVISNDNDYWLISMKNITVTNEDSDSNTLNSTDDHSKNEREVIIDTGTTGFALPLEDADNLHKQMFGDDLITDDKGNYAFPCDMTSPKFSVSVNGHALDVDVKDFKGKEYTSKNLKGKCASMIQGLDSNYWVFGAAFLSKFYTVFDLEHSQIGFGDARINSYTLQQGSSSSFKSDPHDETTGSSFMVSNSTSLNDSSSEVYYSSITSMVSTSATDEADSESSKSSANNSSSTSVSEADSESSDADNSGAAVQYSILPLLVALMLCII